MELLGNISSMQHFSTGDGPGIRTTVFLQGCPLHCEWCHNPETISKTPVLLYYHKLCVRCGECSSVCPSDAHEVTHTKHIFNRGLCRMCGACAKVCHAKALVLSGQKRTVSEVMQFIREDEEFYRMSGGGVTISGGEPLIQPEFTAALARECRDCGIPVIIDTSGSVDFSAFEKVIPFTDTFFFDVKSLNGEDYREKTGGDLKPVLENLHRLVDAGCDVVVRIPVIPGFSDSAEYCAAMAQFLIRVGVKQVNLLPFHRLGASKYAALGKEYPYEHAVVPGTETMQKLLSIFSKTGLSAETDG